MLRSNGDCGEVRKGHSISVPYRTVHEASAWGSKGVISSMFAWTARSFISGWKEQPGFKDIQRRCRISTPAILVKVSTFDKMPHGSPASNRSDNDRRSRRNAWGVDKTKAETRADWVTRLFYLVGTGMKLPIPVPGAPIGTTRPRTLMGTSVGAAFVSTLSTRSIVVTTRWADLLKCGQPILSSFGEYITRFGRTWSSGTSKHEAGIP